MIPREPRAVEARYMRELVRVSRVVQGVMAWGFSALLEQWPRGEVLDARPPRTVRSAYPGSIGTDPSYNPLAPRPRLPRIWNLSDQELRALWPGIQPEEIREFAPWAVSRGEVRRISGGQGEDYVRRAIAAERSSRPRDARNNVEIVPPRRAPYAFRLRPREYAPVILGANGLPMMPPAFNVVGQREIQRTMEWVQLATSQALTVENLNPIVGRAGQQLNLFNTREMNRVLGINVRDIPGVQGELDQWRRLNVGLIESGLMAPSSSPSLRAGLLGDVSDVIEMAHREGIRVEVLAQELVDRFGVSERRAELIARDQTLKLNGQINKHRQQAAGITKYTWGTSGDEQVRETHAALDGTTQSWDSPPEVAPGRFEHPGGDFQCRCVGIPIIPE
jgi:SPP1 gp7 family putative phage head morphogenesis protein